jgi:multidrug efflux pump subunit AcrA (membrane-fusion protein)
MADLPTKKKAIAWVVGILAILYLGYRVYESQQDAAALEHETSEGALSTVSIVNAKPVPPHETITLPGNIQAWYQAPIYARVTGYVKMWFKDYGAHVKKGDVLAEINTPALDAEYQQAKADVESERAHYALAQISAARWAAMRKNHAVSEQSITVREKNALAQAAKLKAAEQHVKNIEAFINFKTVVAP